MRKLYFKYFNLEPKSPWFDGCIIYRLMLDNENTGVGNFTDTASDFKNLIAGLSKISIGIDLIKKLFSGEIEYDEKIVYEE